MNIKNNKKLFHCEYCDYNTSRKSQIDRHLLTAKHKNRIDTTKNTTKKELHVCKCGKKYNHRASLYNHKKKCNYDIFSVNELSELKVPEISNEFILKLINENKDFKDLIIKQQEQIIKQQEQISELLPKVGNNNKINSNNKLNINVFLNEQCKDAISINDFVKSVQISMENLLTTKNKGLSAGLNDIISENMSKLSLYERPIHCTDKKRETLYVKHDNWEKDIEKINTNSMLKSLQMQQIKNLHKFKEAHPNYEENDELKHEYMLLLNKCTKSLDDVDKKLFKNLCDITYLKNDELVIK